jgi:hypothetical protein
MPRYVFDEVRAALREYWGLDIYRGADDKGDGTHDGRWAVEYSKTGYVVHGHMPGRGFNYRRFASLAAIVRVCDLEDSLRKQRAKRAARG